MPEIGAKSFGAFEKAKPGYGVLTCGMVVFADNNEGSSSDTQPIFAMSNDDGASDDVKIAAVLLFSEEGRILKNAIAALADTNQRLTVRLAAKATGTSGAYSACT